MSSPTHGTVHLPDRHHPVFDIRHWETLFPLAANDRREGGWICSPSALAKREQAFRLAKAHGNLGPTVPSDVFVWSCGGLSKKPWLTRIGGKPWREKKRPWPRDEEGIPLVFLGQICFTDSKDILPCELPGDVALLFGTFHNGWVSLEEGSALEWSSIELTDPYDGFGASWTSRLPYELHGVVHRTEQCVDREFAEPTFESLGFKDGGWGVQSVQATSITRYANLPQGWPLDDDELLIGVLSTFYFGGSWPLCDVPESPKSILADGRSFGAGRELCPRFGIGDAGCIWIYRDSDGEFRLGDACG